MEDAGDFGGPHGVEGDFNDDASRFEGGVFGFRGAAVGAVVFSVVEVAAEVCGGLISWVSFLP